MRQERSAILNPEHRGRRELFQNPSNPNAPVCTVAVFFPVFPSQFAARVTWSARSLKVNVVLFNWSDFTGNYRILSATFWLPLCTSGLILASILKINQRVILKVVLFFSLSLSLYYLEKNNLENANLL